MIADSVESSTGSEMFVNDVLETSLICAVPVTKFKPESGVSTISSSAVEAVEVTFVS